MAWKPESQRRADIFKKLYDAGKARIGATDGIISKIIGLSRQTLSAKKKDPESMSFGAVLKIGKALAFSDEEWLSIIHAKK